MKTSKSPENEEVTPSKKKLKQARLPFKILSDASAKPDTPPSRKRKLSAPEPAPVTKIGKVTKENEIAEALVVISDDDSQDVSKVEREDKSVNPLVKLVDNAWKKKRKQKSKSLKKKKGSKKSATTNGSVPNASVSQNKDTESVECMEIDEDVQEVDNISDAKESSSSQEKTEENSDDIGLEPKQVSINEDKSEKVQKDTSVGEETEQVDKNASDNEETELLQNGHHSEPDDTDSEETVKQNELDSKSESISVTPKRSARNVNKEKNKLNTSQLSTGDESMTSNTSTPRRSMRGSSVSKSQGDVSLNESNAKLTPKQVQKKLESAKKKEEREKEKEERDKKRQQEKEERVKQRQEKEEQRKREREEKEEVKKKEKEEKEDQKRKEKEEKDRQKELEKKIREEKEEQKRKEKEEKEEQKKKEKEARDEEKRKKQEALELEKLEQEQKKKKAAEAFVNFFVPKQKVENGQPATVSKSCVLSSFAIKSDMRLAPTVRTDLTEEKRQVLDGFLVEQKVPVSSLYVKSLKAGVRKPLSSRKTWPLNDKNDDDDVMIVEDELPPIDGAGELLTCDSAAREKLRPKLFSFHENRRPPYWGTWRKKSTYISPRRPFQQDQKHLDYEVDSDDDWEEEQEGESLDGSAAGSDDEQEADEYEVDNEVFVPHGYLSDEEATMDEDDVLSLSPETQKIRLKHLEDEFELELKKPTEKLKPRLYGLLWETSDGSKPEKCVDALWNYFRKLSMIMNDPTPLLQPSSEPEEGEKKKVKKKKSSPESDHSSPKNEKKKVKQDSKESRKPKSDPKKNTSDIKKNQPGINSFLTKIKS